MSGGSSGERSRSRGHSGLRLTPWNLFLLVPLLMLLPSLYNSDQPRLFGVPFFYWMQFAFVPVGVICVAVVYVMTRNEPRRPGDRPDRLGVDDLDSGEAGEGNQR